MELPIVSESVAKVLAATSISQSLSFCMERKYLENGKNGVDCYSKNGHAVTVLTRQS